MRSHSLSEVVAALAALLTSRTDGASSAELEERKAALVERAFAAARPDGADATELVRQAQVETERYRHPRPFA
jgi:hypothetical protein